MAQAKHVVEFYEYMIILEFLNFPRRVALYLRANIIFAMIMIIIIYKKKLYYLERNKIKVRKFATKLTMCVLLSEKKNVFEMALVNNFNYFA